MPPKKPLSKLVNQPIARPSFPSRRPILLQWRGLADWLTDPRAALKHISCTLRSFIHSCKSLGKGATLLWRQHAVFLLPPPAFGEGGHGSLACRSVAVCRAAVFVVSDVQCPHPWPCYGYTRIEDTADNFATGQHVIIVVLPLGGGTKGRCAFQCEVILFHRVSPGLTVTE